MLAWRKGYEPMRAQLETGGGHGAAIGDPRREVDPILTGCEYADTVLLPAIRLHGRVDQELQPRGGASRP